MNWGGLRAIRGLRKKEIFVENSSINLRRAIMIAVLRNIPNAGSSYRSTSPVSSSALSVPEGFFKIPYSSKS